MINQLTALNILLPNNTINSNAAIMVNKHPDLKARLFNLVPWVNLNQRSSVRICIHTILQNISTQPKCIECTSPCSFNLNTNKYNVYCSKHCGITSKSRTKKIQQTMMQRHGVAHALQSPELQDSKMKTMQRRYGELHAMRNVELKSKQHQTMIERYGAKTTLESIELKSKQNQTMIERYGTIHALQNDDIKSNLIDTNRSRYGVDFFQTSVVDRDSRRKLEDIDWMVHHHHTLKEPLTKIAELLNVDGNTVKLYIDFHGITQRYYYNISAAEQELLDLFGTLGIRTITSDRTIIFPYELDIVLPDNNIAIEYCGLYWHNEVHKKSSYHKMKYDMCKAKGWRLITIFEDEWVHNRTLVEQKLTSMVGCSRSGVYARNCDIVTVSTNDKKHIMNKYHIQGNGNSSINYGLTFHDTVVACISFKRIGYKKFELNRYVSSERVVGGFSKLLTAFKRQHDWDQIITFADLRWSIGKLYYDTGFKLDRELPPDYSYVIRDRRIHKFNYRHKYLPTKLLKYDATMSEHQNMLNNHIYRIWDCGKLRFITHNTG